MAICGNLGTMGLTDLLLWAGRNEKTGVLELERNKNCRRIEFRKGWIGSCSSDEPASRLGQFLLSRGKVTKAQLAQALTAQASSSKRLGLVIVELGMLPRAELARQVEAKATETVQGLFEWDDAVFRFHEGATLDPDQIEVSLSVEQIIADGRRRQEELKKIREVFPSSGIVLGRRELPTPSALVDRPLARRIFESIDGRRTLREILPHAHASEFLVIKFLFRLHQKGILEIREEHAVDSSIPTLLDLDPPVHRQSIDLSGLDLTDPSVSVEVPIVMPSDGGPDGLAQEVEVANRLLEREEYEAALELLNASYRANPNENYLRLLITKTEAAFVDSVGMQGLSSSRIPVLRRSTDLASHPGLGADETFLLSLIDGESDIRSILWLAPLREVDVLRGLRQMLSSGLIQLRDPQSGEELPGNGPVAES